MKLSMTVSAAVRLARMNRGLTQFEAATAARLNYRYFQRVESGKHNLTLTVIDQIAEGLGHTPVSMMAQLFFDPRADEVLRAMGRPDDFEFWTRVSPEGLIVDIDPRLLKLRDVTRKSVIGRPMWENSSEENATFIQSYHKHIVRNQPPEWPYFLSVKTRVGEIVARISWSARNDSGRVVEVLYQTLFI